MRLLGAVLAGGQSLRFGSDKALALLNGKPLIAHAIDALAAQTDAVIVCGREWGDWVPDRPEAGMGPLGAINAALHCAVARGYDAVLTAPCDVHLLPTGLAERLKPMAFVAQIPVIGYWPVSLADRLDAFLAESDDRSVRAWARAADVPARTLEVELPNLNTLDDLEALRRETPPAP